MSVSGPVRLKRLWVLSLGFLWQRHLRQHLAAAGWRVTFLPVPRPDAVGVWGRRPASRRGLLVARWLGLPVLTIEDAFLRSVQADGSEPPLGLILDPAGVHFDPARPSKIENLLNDAANFTSAILLRARDGMAVLRSKGLSKYSPVRRGLGVLPARDFILVADQVHDDASVAFGGAGAGDFARMLDAALAENPDKIVLVRRHPDRRRGGYFDHVTPSDRVRILDVPMNPWDLLEAASAVYCVSSQLGFEAILAGHQPHVFGAPFYAGWGLSHDRVALPRRKRRVAAEELFAAAMLLAPDWYDPVLRRSVSFEQACQALLARAEQSWDSPARVIMLAASRWKRGFLRRFAEGISFENSVAAAIAKARLHKRQLAVWASKEPAGLADLCRSGSVPLLRVEDGFLRSVGLGSELHAPASLVIDRTGIYYDPNQPSDLEKLIAASASLGSGELERAARLRAMLVAKGTSKYNLSGPPLPQLPPGKCLILVPGQVEDDASIRLGCDVIRSNAALLAAVRNANPAAFLIYKPHPDVVAGLRQGALRATTGADLVLTDVGMAALLAAVDEVWTMTSLTGFEALLRGKTVVTCGMPFYAGWGLTTDLGTRCPRRIARPSLDGLVHATLIDYPVYNDPRSGLAATPEQIVELLARGGSRRTGGLAAASWLQKRLRKLGSGG